MRNVPVGWTFGKGRRTSATCGHLLGGSARGSALAEFSASLPRHADTHLVAPTTSSYKTTSKFIPASLRENAILRRTSVPFKYQIKLNVLIIIHRPTMIKTVLCVLIMWSYHS